MDKNVIVLGSTGSVGTQTLEVCEHLGVRVTGLCCNENIKLCEEQIRRFKPLYCAVYDEKKAKELELFVSDTPVKILSGKESLCELASFDIADTLVNSLSGQIGLNPTIAAIKSGKNIALANKETLVVAGETVMRLAKENNVSILPIDSEHSAILQCIADNKKSEIKKLIITASGGPFFGRRKEELENVTVGEALNHPTWTMGRKITIDSATLMNKGLEVIEASHLFGIDCDNIDVIVHRESIIHSMVEFVDNTVISQMGCPDMRMCIQYALLYPVRQASLCKPLNLVDVGSLSFRSVDNEAFPSINLAKYALKKGGLAPAALNSANETAVWLFLEGRIKFNEIYNIAEEFVYNYKSRENPSAEEIFFAVNEIKQIITDRFSV